MRLCAVASPRAIRGMCSCWKRLHGAELHSSSPAALTEQHTPAAGLSRHVFVRIGGWTSGAQAAARLLSPASIPLRGPRPSSVPAPPRLCVPTSPPAVPALAALTASFYLWLNTVTV